MTKHELALAKAAMAKRGISPKTKSRIGPIGARSDRKLPKYVHATGFLSSPYKVCVRRNKILQFHGSFKTLEDATKKALEIGIMPGMGRI